jgi:hypothetical protein
MKRVCERFGSRVWVQIPIDLNAKHENLEIDEATGCADVLAGGLR